MLTVTGMNFIHRRHLEQAARAFREERLAFSEWYHCYPFFPVVALTLVIKTLRAQATVAAQPDADVVKEFATVWRLVREALNNKVLQYHLDLLREVSAKGNMHM